MDIRNTKIRCGGGEQSLVYVPLEIVEVILPNLSVKSLLRLRCVSKSWRSLIDTKKFIKEHLENSRRRAIYKEYCSIIESPYGRMHEPIIDPLNTGDIIGCYNGVMCILKQGHFFLCNQATRIFIQLPTFYFIDKSCIYCWEEIRCGFGWDEESDAYKVFVYIKDRYGENLGHVYSSKTNSWKKLVDCGDVYLCGTPNLYNVGVLACGKIHWVPERALWILDSENNYTQTYVIEYFDLKSEVFGRIELPACEPEDGVGRWWLRERDGCFYALYNHNDDDKKRRRYRRREGEEEEEEEEKEELFDVWVMEEYGVKEAWVKERTIPILKSTLDYQQYVYVESLISPVCDQRGCDAEQRN